MYSNWFKSAALTPKPVSVELVCLLVLFEIFIFIEPDGVLHFQA